MYRGILIILFLFIQVICSAQQVNDQTWESEEDYRKDENVILEDILWLENNPLATATNDTKAITGYVLNWLTGTPYISVTYDEIFLSGLTNSKKYKFGEKFRVTYLLGKAYYLIQHQDKPDEARACARGIEGMVKVYTELKKVDPSVRYSLLEKYTRLSKRDRTLSYVQTMLEKSARNNL